MLYGAVGVFHCVFRRRFLEISMDPHRAEAEGVSIRFWDFLFYASFGFVVTSSVSIAGVLLVFCYLIVPSVAAMLYAKSVGRRLAIGWSMGTIVSALGVYLSLKLDLPTGATIVCTFGLVLILMAVRPAAVPSLTIDDCRLRPSRLPTDYELSQMRNRDRGQGARVLQVRHRHDRARVRASRRGPRAIEGRRSSPRSWRWPSWCSWPSS